MVDCLRCGDKTVKKDGTITRKQMTKQGMRNRPIQKYRCSTGHQFTTQGIASFSPAFVEHVVYIYLRCLSLNTTIDIVRETYEEEILSKQLILEFIVAVADQLPSPASFAMLYHPKRSGYLAFDGVWFSYKGEQVVLMVAFDPVTFDILAAKWAHSETASEYRDLMAAVKVELPTEKWKGGYGDGDKGLLLAWKELVPQVPFQLCVVHKELRMGQRVPIKSINRSRRFSDQRRQELTDFKQLFEACLYGESKKECLSSLKKLKTFIDQHDDPAFLTSYHSLKHNFALTLTHHDYPEMDRDNNMIECFNGIIKPRLRLMRGFKKEANLDHYLNLFLLEYRFRPLRESRFQERRGKSPLQLSQVITTNPYNFVTYLRQNLNLNYQLN